MLLDSGQAVVDNLSHKLRAQFVAMHGHNAAHWSVRDLREFVQNLIVRHYEQVDRQAGKDTDLWCQ